MADPIKAARYEKLATELADFLAAERKYLSASETLAFIDIIGAVGMVALDYAPPDDKGEGEKLANLTPDGESITMTPEEYGAVDDIPIHFRPDE